jgi:hypothetical protein
VGGLGARGGHARLRRRDHEPQVDERRTRRAAAWAGSARARLHRQRP